MSTIFMRCIKGVSVLAPVVGFLVSSPVNAQTTPFGPWPAQPPSYGAPTNALLVPYTTRTFIQVDIRPYFTTRLNAVQKLLPAGLTAIPTSTNQTVIGVSCEANTSIVLTNAAGAFAPGTYGPYNTGTVAAVATNSANQVVAVVLQIVANNQEAVELLNATFGPGTAVYGEVDTTDRVISAQLQADCTVKESPAGLHYHVTMTAPDQINAQSRTGSTAPSLFQYAANPPMWGGGSGDTITVPAADITVSVSMLKLTNGSLPILGLYAAGVLVSGIAENAEGFNAPAQ